MDFRLDSGSGRGDNIPAFGEASRRKYKCMAKAKKSKMAGVIRYPEEVLRPVKGYLMSKLSGLQRRKKELVKEDPFSDTSRLNDNAAIDTDAAERVGHMQVSAIKKVADRSIIQIRKALSMIKVGKYGVWGNCGKMIDTDRLMVMPETTLCVECERKREK